MVKIGELNRLQVVKQDDAGLYLDAGKSGTILLPASDVPDSFSIGDKLEVFIYRDSEDDLIATTQTPLAMVGQCAYLKVVDVNRFGAFLDWGLPKDLLVPYGQQQIPMKPGHSYVVYVYLDENTQRITASSKLYKFLAEESIQYDVNDAVKIMICAQTDMAYKAVIDNNCLGLLYKNELKTSLTIGQQLNAYIKTIRDDDKIDLKLDLPSERTRDELSARILQYLSDHGGQSEITDKSSPELIYKQFTVSKSSYKKALGNLYKARLITIGKDKISLT